MGKQQTIDRIIHDRLFAVIRLKSTAQILEIANAIVRGGIEIIEITLNSANAFDAIHKLSKEFPNCLIGAGTVIGYDATAKAIESGAKFLVSPVTDLEMLAVAREVKMPVMAGALTPTEAWQATEAGADFVKVFPLAGIGPDFIRAMRGPLPNIRYVATNGVRVETIPDFLRAGVSAIGLGSPLISDADLNAPNWDAIESRARAAVHALTEPR